MPTITPDFYEKTDLWTYLSSSGKPIVLYGMGNGADKIVCELSKRGLCVSDFFASSEFVRGQTFHDKKVLDFPAIKEKYKGRGYVVLLSFGSSRPEVLENIRRINNECELYVPDMPVYGDRLFDRAMLEARFDEIARARESLFNDRSREIFDALVNYKLSGRISFLDGTESSRQDIMSAVLAPEKYRNAIDLGAFVGDSAAELMSYAHSLEHVIALEPDTHSFKRLSSMTSPKLTAINAIAADFDGEVMFSNEGNKNSSIYGRKKQISTRAVKVDTIACDMHIDYIKIDVEGAEREALRGASETIGHDKPDIALSIYHRCDDFFDLVNIVRTLCPDHRLYIRRPDYLPPWDTSLYAVISR